jgi:alkylation response protein AidB-like acyl-CoA dehydrogenase
MPALDLHEILGRTGEIVDAVVAPSAVEIDRDARWPAEAMRALQAAALGGLVVPEASGGLGHGMFALARVCERIGYACPSTGLCFGMHSVAAAVLAARATGAQQRRYLEPIAQGTHLTTLALSEPGAGAHFYLPQTTLHRTADGYRAEGVKAFVTNGGYADSYVVSTVAAEPTAAPGQFSCVVVPAEAPGLVWGPPWAGLGMRGNASRNVELREVPVPAADLLGQEGDQLWYVFEVIAPYFLVAMAGTYLGLASAALEESRTHLGDRRHAHSGLTLAQQPVLQHRLGTLWATVERSRRLLYYAAAQGDAGGPDALPALFSAKADVADCAVQIANEALTLGGGRSYQPGTRLDRALRDARAAHVMSPTTDLLRLWTGRAVLGQPLLGE